MDFTGFPFAGSIWLRLEGLGVALVVGIAAFFLTRVVVGSSRRVLAMLKDDPIPVLVAL